MCSMTSMIFLSADESIYPTACIYTMTVTLIRNQLFVMNQQECVISTLMSALYACKHLQVVDVDCI